MDISINSAVNAVLAQKEINAQQEVQVAMFKKALDTQTQNAMSLIESLPQAPSSKNLPANLGQNINTTA